MFIFYSYFLFLFYEGQFLGKKRIQSKSIIFEWLDMLYSSINANIPLINSGRKSWLFKYILSQGISFSPSLPSFNYSRVSFYIGTLHSYLTLKNNCVQMSQYTVDRTTFSMSALSAGIHMLCNTIMLFLFQAV